MANQNHTGSVDRKYLKAMGIDLWVDRNSQPPAGPVVPVQTDVAGATLTKAAPTLAASTPAASTTAASTPAASNKALAAMSATEFAKSISELQLVCNKPAGSVDLLVLTEGTGLSDECRVLLDSMFGAIKLESSQWLQADFSQAISGCNQVNADSLQEVESVLNPKAVVLLLRSGGSLASLDKLRGMQHKSDALQSFVVVSFHPQDLLDNSDAKRPAWEDLKRLRQWIG